MRTLAMVVLLLVASSALANDLALTCLRDQLAALARDAKRAVRAEDVARYHCGPETRVRADDIKGDGTYLIGRPESGDCTAHRLAAEDQAASVRDGMRHALSAARAAGVPEGAIRSAIRAHRLASYETEPTKKPAGLQSGREIADQLLAPRE